MVDSMVIPKTLDRYRSIVDDFPRFVEACYTPLRTTFRINQNRSLDADLSFWLAALSSSIEPISWLDGAYRITGTESLPFVAGYLAGLFHIQEASSMLPVMLLHAQPGDRVLDLCAAPGNKTAQLADAVGVSGTVVANDLSRSRLGVVRTTVDRLGHTNIFVTAADARRYPAESGRFDRVLADVPCTCEGTSRRHPNVLLASHADFRDQLIDTQTRILENALNRCRPGGFVAYATCTFAPEECEGVVSKVLETTAVGRRSVMVPVKVDGLNSQPGLRRFNDTEFHPDLEHAMRVWPHESDTGGFFVAILQRESGSDDASFEPEVPFAAKPTSTGRSSQVPTLAATLELEDLIRDELKQFSISDAVTKRFHVTGESRKYLSIVSRACTPPPAEMVIGSGIRGINVKGEPGRMSTAGIMLLGPQAGEGLVDLDLSQLRAYLTRNVLSLHASGDAGVPVPSETGPNPDFLDETDLHSCLIRCGGLVFGRGLLAGNADHGKLTSLFPRIWAGVDVVARLRQISS